MQCLDAMRDTSNNTSPVKPSNVVAALTRKDKKFRCGVQNCAQEALFVMLQALEEECSRLTGPKPPYRELSGTGSERAQADEAWSYHKERSDSLIDDIFRLQLESVVTCSECGHRSLSFDPASDLSVPLPSSSKRGSDVASGVALEDCLASFFAAEELPPSAGYRCEGCKAHGVAASKQLMVYRWPKELIVTLKRFSAGMFGTSKNNAAIKLPNSLQVDLTSFCSEDSLDDMQTYGGGEEPVYQLYAVSCHTGSLSFGHYTAVCDEGGSWKRFDDANVTPTSSPPIASSEPYVLFFKRVGAR